MKSKIIESVGYISIALILALTLVLSFSVVEFNSGVTAQAVEENVIDTTYSLNSVPVASGAVLVYDDFEQELEPLWSYTYGASELDLSSLDLTAGVYQIVCEAYTGFDESVLITNLVYVDSQFPAQPISLSDYTFGDSFFTVVLNIDSEILSVDFFNTFEGGEGNYVTFLALYKIEENAIEEPITDSFFSIIGNGISFGFEAIADGITYTVENLFFVDGRLSDFSIIIFCMTGVSLALAVIKYILRIIFSFGGIKL